MPTAILLAFFVVALVLRLWDLGGASLWLDEAMTIDLASLPWTTLWVTGVDPTPPLFYTVEKLPLLFGETEFLLRLPSALFGALSVVVIAHAASRVGGLRSGIVAGLLLTFSFHQIEYGQEARAYALLGFWLSLGFWSLIQITQDYSVSNPGGLRGFLRSGGGLFWFSTLAAVYTHNVALMFWATANLYFLILWALRYRGRMAPLVYWVLINLMVLIPWLPWLRAMLWMMHGDVFNWLAQQTPGQALETWRAVHGFAAVQLGQPYLDFGLLFLGVFGLYTLKSRSMILVLSLLMLGASSLLIWAVGLVATPIYMLRTILWGSMFSAFLVGIAVGNLPRPAGVMTAVLIGALGTASTTKYFSSNAAEDYAWREAVGRLEQSYHPGDHILICALWGDAPLLYYARQIEDRKIVFGWIEDIGDLTTGVVAWEGKGRPSRIDWSYDYGSARIPVPAAHGSDRLLAVISDHCRDRNDSGLTAINRAGWALESKWKARGVVLYRFEPAQAGRP